MFLLAEPVSWEVRDRLFLNKNSSVVWPEIIKHFLKLSAFPSPLSEQLSEGSCPQLFIKPILALKTFFSAPRPGLLEPTREPLGSENN